MRGRWLAVVAAGLGIVVARTSNAAPLPPRHKHHVASPHERDVVGNNALYFELLGQGFLYSINYERQINDFTVRLGFAEMSGILGYRRYASRSSPAYESGTYLSVPVTLGYVGLGSKTNMLETTAGATLLYLGQGNSWNGYETAKGESKALVLPTFSLGYRLKPCGEGFLFRIGAAGLVTPGGDIPILPWPYLSLGAAFR